MLTFSNIDIINIEEINKVFLRMPLICSSIYTRPFEASYILDFIKDYPQISGILLKNCGSFLHNINKVINDIKDIDSNIKIAFEINNPNLMEISKYLSNFDYIKVNTSESKFLFYEVLHYPESTGVLIPEHRISDITYKFNK